MSSVVMHEAYDAGRILFVGGLIAGGIYRGARASGEKRGRTIALLRWVGGVFGLALLVAIMMGSPSCRSSDEYGCDDYADDRFAPSLDQRLGGFVWVAMVLGVPAGFGVLESRRSVANPWAKPEAKIAPE